MTMISAGVIAFRHWMPMWPRPPAPITTAWVPGAEHRDRLLDRVDRGQAGVGQRRDVLGLEAGVQLDHRAGRGEQEVGEPAVAVDPGERAVQAVHVIAAPAWSAQPAGDERVDDHGVAPLRRW